MKIIGRAEVGYGYNYLIVKDDDAVVPYEGPVQIVFAGGIVSPPVYLGSLVAHDPYTDWRPVADPPPLAHILADVTKWPEGDLWMPGMEPLLTREVGERIIAAAKSGTPGTENPLEGDVGADRNQHRHHAAG